MPTSDGMIQLKIARFVRHQNATDLKAFCDVSVDGHLLIKGIRVVEGRHGLFVSMPRQKSTKGDWHDSIVPLTKELKQELYRVVLEAYDRTTK